ncbi:DUF998 domain-containing protein [Microbacterium sp. NPDC012755]|uniref:DUF998 domain-containing protein n=1 Tax=Microbacterium sp. NPDC012755 TaxID=3364184 RepID=UPI0036C28505
MMPNVVDIEPARPSLGADVPRRRRAGIGALSGALGLVIIWCCRTALDGNIYVSAMGAAGVATAPWFNLALILVAAAAILVATALPPAQPRHRILSPWPAGATLLASGTLFAFAAAVPCTVGCPVPFTPTSTVQDLLHVTAAALGFTAAVTAVLQVWDSSTSRATRILSATTMIVVALTALAGAYASLTRWGGGSGGWFEFAATTVALMWITGYGVALSRTPTRYQRSARAQTRASRWTA